MKTNRHQDTRYIDIVILGHLDRHNGPNPVWYHFGQVKHDFETIFSSRFLYIHHTLLCVTNFSTQSCNDRGHVSWQVRLPNILVNLQFFFSSACTTVARILKVIVCWLMEKKCICLDLPPPPGEGGGGTSILTVPVSGTCRWTGYDFPVFTTSDTCRISKSA